MIGDKRYTEALDCISYGWYSGRGAFCERRSSKVTDSGVHRSEDADISNVKGDGVAEGAGEAAPDAGFVAGEGVAVVPGDGEDGVVGLSCSPYASSLYGDYLLLILV